MRLRLLGPLCAGLVFSGVSINGPFYMGALIVAPAILLALSAGRAARREQMSALAAPAE